jgi:cyclopropane-fatty-acyl-phospholipid synthase
MIEERWIKALREISCGAITFEAPDGSQRRFAGCGEGAKAHLRINEWQVIEQAIARGDIGLGESYISGAWETGDLEALITFFLQNQNELKAFGVASFANRIAFGIRNNLLRRNSPRGSRRNIISHYDTGNDFFALWLDETMTYSGALFDAKRRDLAAAQRAKYARILSRFDRNRLSILEIGCGWGGFAEEASRLGHRITALTISPAQHAYATARLGETAEIRLEDYRQSRGCFDAVVSIEMVEAVGERYWPVYFRTLAERLRRGGRAIIQTILIREDLFASYRDGSDFIRHYVFPGGLLPSLSRLKEEAERAGLKFLDAFSFGQDYAHTLRAWNARMRAREEAIRALGHGDDFIRSWQFYFGMCAAAFSVSRTDVAQIEFVRQ